MKHVICISILCLLSSTMYAQTTKAMNTDKLTNPVVKKAINALQSADRETWFSLFSSDAALYDDGNKMNFRTFFEKALARPVTDTPHVLITKN